MINELKKQLPFNTISIAFNKRDGFTFLDIELDEKDLKIIENRTKIILKILNEIDKSNEKYFLNVFSCGTEKEILKKNLREHLGEYIYIKTKKTLLKKNEWEGYLKNVVENEIEMLVNNKGRFQKLKVDISDIEYSKKTAKLSKGANYE